MSMQPSGNTSWQDVPQAMPVEKRTQLVGFAKYEYLESHVTDNLLDSLSEKEDWYAPTTHYLFELSWIGTAEKLCDWYQCKWLAPKCSRPTRMTRLYHCLVHYYRQLHKPEHRALRQQLQNEYIKYQTKYESAVTG